MRDIDFHSYEQVKLEDVAEFGRAKQGHVYPRGATTLQISASRGQLGYLDFPSEVPTKDVVIIPQAGIHPRYFNYVMHKNIDSFMRKYSTGLNVQENEVGQFPIEIHNGDTQEAVVRFLEFMDEQEKIIQDEIDGLTKTKKAMLNMMMVCSKYILNV